MGRSQVRLAQIAQPKALAIAVNELVSSAPACVFLSDVD
jgi:hypothetical protein